MSPHRLLTLLAAAAIGALAPAAAQNPAGALPDPDRSANCVYCHGLEGREAAVGIHRRSGVDCIECHGGAADARSTAEAHAGEFRALADPVAAVEFCGRCHSDGAAMGHFGLKTDQLSLYRSSSHGRALFEQGDTQVATCLNCHGVHAVFATNDPRSSAYKPNLTRTCMACHEDPAHMEGPGIDTGIPGLYRDSIHGRSLLENNNLASPGCGDCHGSHGASPPRVGSIEAVCGHCHSTEREQFRQSPHYQASLRGEISECTSCHSNHAVQVLGLDDLVADGGLCEVCHSGAGDPARGVATAIHDGVVNQAERIRQVEDDIAAAALRGVFLRDDDGYLAELRSLRLSSAPVTHTASVELLANQLNRGEAMISKTLKSLATQQNHLRDLRIFAGVFLVVAVLLAGLILAYRRSL